MNWLSKSWVDEPPPPTSRSEAPPFIRARADLKSRAAESTPNQSFLFNHKNTLFVSFKSHHGLADVAHTQVGIPRDLTPGPERDTITESAQSIEQLKWRSAGSQTGVAYYGLVIDGWCKNLGYAENQKKSRSWTRS